MLLSNECSAVSRSLIAKSRCYWKFVTESLSQPQLFCWEHGRSDELCLNIEQDLVVLLVTDHRVWAPGPPCGCSATFLSIFRAAARNGSDRNVCYYSGVFAFQVYFPRSILGKKCRCLPANHFLFTVTLGGWGNSLSVRVKLKHIATVFLFPSHTISKAKGISVFVFLFLTQDVMK